VEKRRQGLQYFERGETTSPQSGDLVLPLSAPQSWESTGQDLPQNLLQEPWLTARAAASGLTCDEFSIALYSWGEVQLRFARKRRTS
jgi:hypothetical protein